MKSLVETVRDVLFPPVCANCRRAGAMLCAVCRQQIQWIKEPVCCCCGRLVKVTAVPCPTCQTHPLPLRQIRAATIFADPITTIIHKMKYEGFFGLAELLADLMVEAWPQWQVTVDRIVPVPLHPDREKKRGYNQSALLARRMSRQLGLVYAPSFLSRTRYTQPQVGLNASDRLTNVKDAFAVATKEVLGKHILLIDDVCTTGATMATAAQALLEGGACSVSGYCVARAM